MEWFNNKMAIAYGLDSLVPGFYLWLGDLKIRLGESEPEATYPGIIHSPDGAVAITAYHVTRWAIALSPINPTLRDRTSIFYPMYYKGLTCVPIRGTISSWENVPAYRIDTYHFKAKQKGERSQNFPDGYSFMSVLGMAGR